MHSTDMAHIASCTLSTLSHAQGCYVVVTAVFVYTSYAMHTNTVHPRQTKLGLEVSNCVTVYPCTHLLTQPTRDHAHTLLGLVPNCGMAIDSLSFVRQTLTPNRDSVSLQTVFWGRGWSQQKAASSLHETDSCYLSTHYTHHLHTHPHLCMIHT